MNILNNYHYYDYHDKTFKKWFLTLNCLKGQLFNLQRDEKQLRRGNGRWCGSTSINRWLSPSQHIICIWLRRYGGFHKWEYHIYGWFILEKHGKNQLKWMIWGYPYFRKPPYEYYSTFSHQFQAAKQHNWLSLFQQKTWNFSEPGRWANHGQSFSGFHWVNILTSVSIRIMTQLQWNKHHWRYANHGKWDAHPTKNNWYAVFFRCR